MLGSRGHGQARGGIEQTFLGRLDDGARAGLGQVDVLDVARARHATSGAEGGEHLLGGDGRLGEEAVHVGSDLIEQLGLVAVVSGSTGGGEVVRHHGEHQGLVLCGVREIFKECCHEAVSSS